ncbi:hypothetical protein [Flavivirga algicola]
MEEKSLRDIIKGKNYQISLSTIYKICESREIKLSDFFIAVEKWGKSTKS